jgi:hypothetical protein
LYKETKGQEKSDRLINITKQCSSNHYINPEGGNTIYNKDYFQLNGVTLSFIKNELLPYKQFNDFFVDGLSIIDVLMFNTKENVIDLLTQYKLN